MPPIAQKDVLESYNTHLKEAFVHNLKAEQVEIITHIINRDHVFAVLPTGYGKSLCYVLPALLKDKVHFAGLINILMICILAVKLVFRCVEGVQWDDRCYVY